MADRTPEDKRNPTMREVAAEAGCSITTVSHVLNDTRHVDEETRAKVIQAIQKLDYKPNTLAQGLKGKGTKTIGVLISDITEDFFARITKSIESTADGRGYAVILCDSEEEPAKESFSLEMLLRKGVDGIIYAPVDTRSVPRVLSARRVPLVQIDRRCAGLEADFVGTDNADAVRQLTAHILGHGRRRLGFVGYESSIYTMGKRMEGFRTAIAAVRGASGSELLLTPRSDTHQEDVRAWLREEGALQGVICGNANIFNAVLSAVEAAGLKVPQDVAMGSFDDTEWYRFLRSPVTAVSQPTELLGREAARLLFERIETKSRRPAQERLLPSRLIVRASCGCTLDPTPVVDRSENSLKEVFS
jgi:LacI family transcriptional regulator